MATKEQRVLRNENRAAVNRELMTDLGFSFSNGRKSGTRLVPVPGKEPRRVPTNNGNGDPDRPSVLKRLEARRLKRNSI